MGKAYFSSAIHKVPNAVKKIVFDRYHVMAIATKAVDQVRRDENTRITRKGEASPLAKTRYMWLYSEENLPEKNEESFAELKARELLTAKAWGMKELLRKRSCPRDSRPAACWIKPNPMETPEAPASWC